MAMKLKTMMEVPYAVTVRMMLASLERNLLPDALIRRLTRLLLSTRLRLGYAPSAHLQLAQLLQFAHSLRDMPIAINTDDAKLQHYELPTSFFKLVLGENLKYRDFDFHNVEIIVANISTFDMEASYDRIFSIGMFEHMKNYTELLRKISHWMKPDSLLFVHHFCHRAFAYHFEDIHKDDWITRYFFSGGTMPSANLLLYFQLTFFGPWVMLFLKDDVSVVNHWLVNGKHYAQTSEEWLKNMDKNMSSVRQIMESTYGKDSAVKWTVYWRTFFIAVAELFAYNNGEEWMVALFLFKKK